jgi:integrase/recombinase XerD
MTPDVPRHALVLRGRTITLPRLGGAGLGPTAPRPLAAHVEPFLGWLALVRRRRPLTIEQYRRNLRQFIPFCEAVGRPFPADLDHRVIEGYLAWLQSPERGLGAATAAQHLHTIRGLCLYLTREGVMPRNVAAEAFGPKVVRPLPKDYLSIAEQEHVLEALSRVPTLTGRRNYTLVAFGLFTGARCEEMAALPLVHVHLDAGRVLICGKGGRDRELPLVPRLVAILGGYVTDVRPALLAGQPSPFFFVRTRREWTGGRQGRRRGLSDALTVGATHNASRAGLPLERRSVWWILEHAVSPLVGRHLSPHQLRHSFATRLRSQGADLQYVQQLLGHADIRTTTVYSHLVTTAQRETLARYLEPLAAATYPTTGRTEDDASAPATTPPQEVPHARSSPVTTSPSPSP